MTDFLKDISTSIDNTIGIKQFEQFDDWLSNHKQTMGKLTTFSSFFNKKLFNPSVLLIIIAFSFSTSIGSWGGFSDPPQIFRKLVTKWYVRYFLLFVLIWQGGGDGNLHVSLLGTVLFAIAEYFVKKYDTKIQKLFGFDPEVKL